MSPIAAAALSVPAQSVTKRPPSQHLSPSSPSARARYRMVSAACGRVFEKSRWQDFAVMGVTVLLLTIILLNGSRMLNRQRKLAAVLPVGRRALGSWITAIAVLWGALALMAKPI